MSVDPDLDEGLRYILHFRCSEWFDFHPPHCSIDERYYVAISVEFRKNNNVCVDVFKDAFDSGNFPNGNFVCLETLELYISFLSLAVCGIFSCD